MCAYTTQAGYRADAFQEEVIHCRALGIRVVAPAGSGKTETLVRRAAIRIGSKELQAERILVLSFDNSAKKSFEQKYRQLAPKLKLPEISTLNSFGKRILRMYFGEENAELIRDAEKLRLKSEFERHRTELTVLHWDGRYRPVIDAFDALKNQGFGSDGLDKAKATAWLRHHWLHLPAIGEDISLSELWSVGDDPAPSEHYAAQINRILELYQEYDERLREQGVMDFADQKLRALTCLRKHSDIGERVRAKYDEIVVDECQDINRLDASLIYMVTSVDTTLVLAGDDDQSLYAFREASSLYIREPQRFFKRVFQTCHLNINYRTPQEILSPALSLIGHNFERLDKSPTSGVGHSGSFRVIVEKSSKFHDQRIVAEIRDLISSGAKVGGTIRPCDIALLCPNSEIAGRLRRGLRVDGIEAAPIESMQNVQTADVVVVDTMLKAKGRQWPIVVLPMSNEKLIPSEALVRSGDLEAERRKYYVAMTRAAELLIISYVREDDCDEIYRSSRDEVLATNGASRFLYEAGIVAPKSEATPTTRDSSNGAPIVDPSNNSTRSPYAASSTGNSPLLPTSTTETKFSAENATANAADAIVSKRPTSDGVPPKLISAPARQRRRAAHPWELRQREHESLVRAAKLLKKGQPDDDPVYAVIQTWGVIESVIRRVLGDKNKTPIFELIVSAQRANRIDTRWADQLHLWRQLRNRCVHPEDDERDEADALSVWDRAIAEQMVSQATELFAFIERLSNPTQASLSNDDERISGVSRLVEIIQRGLPHPSTRRRIRALTFRESEDATLMNLMQLSMILRDVRYVVPEQYRWTHSKLFAQLSNDLLGFRHPAIRAGERNLLAPSASSETLGLMKRIVQIEAGAMQAGQFLQRALSEAHRVGNGAYPNGLKLNPKSD